VGKKFKSCFFEEFTKASKGRLFKLQKPYYVMKKKSLDFWFWFFFVVGCLIIVGGIYVILRNFGFL